MAGPVIDIDDSENESFLISLQPAARLPHGGSTSTITGLHPREAYVPTQRVHLLVRRPLRTCSSTSQRSSASSTQAQPRRRLPRASTAGTRAAPYLNSAATTRSEPGVASIPQGVDPITLLAEFTRFMQSRSNPEASPSAVPSAHHLHPAVFSPAPDTYSWTLPNDKGVLPPAAIRKLRAAAFHTGPAATFYPLQFTDWQPAASSHRLGRTARQVLQMLLLDCRKFNDSSLILGASHSTRFGLVNQAALLAAGSPDANFSLDFGTNVSPPPAPACKSYNDLLSAI
ncbi:hypothetical protein PF004_g14907 [Phytophthora fragariae]|uniref:Uncharacterized protein n=1 Tax=Phytophthora fragariae TaxID=53985 RepID=A0A6G0NMV2_9STRA|nr:hypothetical protein PF004_g14907 [Phytophthora fragariae]